MNIADINAENTNRHSKCLCLVLAAGQSTRFGLDDKRFAQLSNGQGVLAQTLAHIQQAKLDFRLAVKAADLENPLLAAWKEHCIVIQTPEKGMGHSLASALSEVSSLSENYTAFIICLADMPFVQASTLRSLEQAIVKTSVSAVLPIFANRQKTLANAGNPVGIKGHFIKLFQSLENDKGGRSILKCYPQDIEFMITDDRGIYQDIDTIQQLS